VLVTTLTSPLLVQRFGARLKVSREEPVDTSLFERILVPVANPTTQQHLIALASILASTVEGTLFPLRVTLKQDNQPLDLQGERQTLESDYLENGEEITIEPVHRVDSSISEGILNAALENRTTLIVMGWRGKATFRESIFGTILDEVIWKSTTPVLVGR